MNIDTFDTRRYPRAADTPSAAMRRLAETECQLSCALPWTIHDRGLACSRLHLVFQRTDPPPLGKRPATLWFSPWATTGVIGPLNTPVRTMTMAKKKGQIYRQIVLWPAWAMRLTAAEQNLCVLALRTGDRGSGDARLEYVA